MFKFLSFKLKSLHPSLKALSMFFVLLLSLLICFALLSGCSGKVDVKNMVKSKIMGEDEMNNAVNAAQEFFNALLDNDLEKSYGLITQKNKSTHSFDDFKAEMKNVTKIVDFEINWIELKSNIAVVGVDIIDSYDEEEKVYKDIEVSLVKEEDGSWRINFFK